MSDDLFDALAAVTQEAIDLGIIETRADAELFAREMTIALRANTGDNTISISMPDPEHPCAERRTVTLQ